MKRKLIIDGNAVYEIDEDCMLKKHTEIKEESKEQKEKLGTQQQNKAEQSK